VAIDVGRICGGGVCFAPIQVIQRSLASVQNRTFGQAWLETEMGGKRTLRSYGRWPDLFANSLSTAVQSPA
jgi:hypothetical protein